MPEEAAIVRRVWHELARRSLDRGGRPAQPGGRSPRRSVDARCGQGHPATRPLLPRLRGREARPRRAPGPARADPDRGRVPADDRGHRRPHPRRQQAASPSATTSCAAWCTARAAPGCAARPTSSAAPSAATTAARRSAAGRGAARPTTSRPRSWRRSPRASCPRPSSTRAKAELRRLLETPEVATAGRQRARLQTRLEQLKKQHAWGDLSDADYQAARDATPVRPRRAARRRPHRGLSMPTGRGSSSCPTRSRPPHPPGARS